VPHHSWEPIEFTVLFCEIECFFREKIGRYCENRGLVCKTNVCGAAPSRRCHLIFRALLREIKGFLRGNKALILFWEKIVLFCHGRIIAIWCKTNLCVSAMHQRSHLIERAPRESLVLLGNTPMQCRTKTAMTSTAWSCEEI